MTQPVTLPLWLVVLILAFATVSFLSHFLFPSVRWFLRRRMQRAVDRLNRRLEHPIQPFKLMARHDMIVRLTHDAQVAEAIAAESARTGVPATVLLERARRYAREIVPAFSATVYFGLAARVAKWLARSVYRVRVASAPAPADPGTTTVYVMNHRSNMDYVLVTWLSSDRATLSYAVGEWARIWPLSWLIRACGAYFIRRRSNDPLYRRVLARYVQLATSEGVTQAIFPEGGLSLDGRVGAPRLGILSYIVEGWSADGPDVVFVPVSIAYDRILEDQVLTRAHARGERRFRTSFWGAVRFVARQVRRVLTGRFQKFGTAAVSFGPPLRLGNLMQVATDDPVAALGEELMRRIVRAMPVLAVPLVCAALQGQGKLSRAELLDRVQDLMKRLQEIGAPTDLAGRSADDALEAALPILARRRVLRETGGHIEVARSFLPLIDFYAASVLQHFSASAEECGGVLGNKISKTT
ncbi:glycerol-3-phosphate acyltransferase [Albidovulum inexpectatum]|uniref:Glycerol-3-phosphate acyltransferase n=1 Tax=Albidovulum inexpectatum TaxID=196587 RepID=A0A2S5JGE3_9RHOB|nr:1-acyl-sn-glycerol-3-phosphate acyltransferase [Albidovulum inexpectatum]PPB80577.1 glycerol-3-phosphate acyltransferase [Albidovulum inexpectatum]